MAGRDGFVDYPLSIPRELMFLVERYQNDMKLVSKAHAFRTLLETHPALDKVAQQVYALANGSNGPDTHGE